MCLSLIEFLDAKIYFVTDSFLFAHRHLVERQSQLV